MDGGFMWSRFALVPLQKVASGAFCSRAKGATFAALLPLQKVARGAFCSRAKGATFAALLAALLVGGTACVPMSAQATKPVSSRNNDLTHGNVEMNLQVARTTQDQVLEIFGAPNIATIDGWGQEVWMYQRQATVTQSTTAKDFWTIVLAGGSHSAAGFEQTQRTMTLIIKFDDKHVVSDFRSRSSEF
jgi:outer membrane protein assembly factor BamE (lipoprotein component of BamABCDE complex)